HTASLRTGQRATTHPGPDRQRIRSFAGTRPADRARSDGETASRRARGSPARLRELTPHGKGGGVCGLFVRSAHPTPVRCLVQSLTSDANRCSEASIASLFLRGTGVRDSNHGTCAVDQSKVSVTSVCPTSTGVNCQRHRCPIMCLQAISRSFSNSTTVFTIRYGIPSFISMPNREPSSNRSGPFVRAARTDPEPSRRGWLLGSVNRAMTRLGSAGTITVPDTWRCYIARL